MKTAMNHGQPGARPRLSQSAPIVGLKTVWFLTYVLVAVFSRGAEPPATDENQIPATNTDFTSEQSQPWKFQAGLSSTVTYDDNIFILPEDEKGDWSAQIAPMFFFGRGNFRDELGSFASIPRFLMQTGEEELPWKNFFYAGYTPEFVLFAKYRDEDAVNHDFRLATRREGDLWNWRGQFHFQNEKVPNIDVGRRIKQTIYTADGSAAYALSGKVSGGVGFLGKRSEYSGGPDSTDARASGFVDYQIAPKTLLGVRVSGGLLDVTSGSNQTYEQALLQIKYLPDGKLSFSGQLGGELRQYDSHVEDRTHFVFDLNGDYQAADGLLVVVDVNRKTTASAEYSGENIVVTTYTGSVRQRLLQRLYLTLAAGFVRNQYENNELTVAVERRDDYYFYRGSFAREVTKHGTVELFYEHRENDSSLRAFKFTSNLAGLSAAFLF